MFTYCNNSPVIHRDSQGEAIETVFDLVSLGFSIAEVCVNPADPWAWAGVAGDLIDLIPFVTGVGEATKAIKISANLVDGADNVYDSARTAYTLSKKADGAEAWLKSTGSYEITFSDGNKYVGKGNFDRALTSARKRAKANNSKAISVSWRSSPNTQMAFIDEYARQVGNGFRKGGKLYNKIWSPGRRMVDVLRHF